MIDIILVVALVLAALATITVTRLLTAVIGLAVASVLVAMILFWLQAPIAGFVGVLGGVLQKIVGTVDAIAKQREAQS